ncbi:hypothetical protein fh0823_27980 (plasmid) [Francisella halioticida]|uniref:hypothetical protein n=1 Tax=Francisella halioticida TaxID=549298 RepID=UPI001AF6A73D|nr:hypothetical protein [Francisella halioticida]BCD92661.1 hypothetical protein fh0823_27980 [Francisella halioticida]
MKTNWLKQIDNILESNDMSVKQYGGFSVKHIYLNDKLDGQSTVPHMICGRDYQECFYKVKAWLYERYLPIERKQRLDLFGIQI